MRILIDAEPLLFKAAAAAEYEVQWLEDNWTYLCEHQEAKQAFKADIEYIQSNKAVSSIATTLLLFSDRTNFRYGVDPTYKGNRKNKRKPAGYGELINWCKETWPSQVLPNVEADDAIGILYRTGDLISSKDKDLKTIPGIHLVEDQIEEIPEHIADLTFFMQVLTGDQADGYPGCPGIGKVGAAKLLAEAGDELWPAVLKAFMKAGLTPADALKQARLARILREQDYDLDAGKVRLWCPPI